MKEERHCRVRGSRLSVAAVRREALGGNQFSQESGLFSALSKNFHILVDSKKGLGL